MKPRPPLPPGPYLVVGLARSGVAAALALRAQGETVTGVDRDPSDRPALAEAAGRLRAAGVEVQLDASGEALAAGAGTIVKSPGVPRDAPAVRAALGRGRPVLGELELAWRLLPNEFVAVTGTNGKTTTTEWIGHIHRQAAAPVAVAGNVGTALASLVGQVPADATVIAECSSFQLEDTSEFAPEVAVLLNLAPDHLDRHGSLESYVAAKLRIFARQADADVAVAPSGLGIDDLGGCGRRVCFGGEGAELADRAGHLWWDERVLIDHDELSLRGAHNRQNAMAAAAACLARGLSPEDVASGLRTFPGVAHRLERVAEAGGIAYVNDSKATNVASTLVALAAFPPGRVHLILGGQGKDQDFTPLRAPVRERCRRVYLIGEDAPAIAAALGASPGAPSLEPAGSLERAVRAAAAAARPGDTVLLSPACASFDQFADFEARGDRFRELAIAAAGRWPS